MKSCKQSRTRYLFFTAAETTATSCFVMKTARALTPCWRQLNLTSNQSLWGSQAALEQVNNPHFAPGSTEGAGAATSVQALRRDRGAPALLLGLLCTKEQTAHKQKLSDSHPRH